MSDVLEELKRTLAQLVAIDSTSTRSNLPVIEALEAPLKALGFELQRHRYVDDLGIEKVNLLALLSSQLGGVPELALVGHTDCVPFDPAWKEALTLTERDGKLYGRGSADTKAFVSCVLTAVRRLSGKKLRRPLLCMFTADEELGCRGAKQLVDAGLGKARYAIAGEPTQLVPIRAHKGYCLAEVEIFGKEGHSAYPATGHSAIFRAARFIERLESYAKGPLTQEQDARFEPPFTSINVGIISGGRAKNVIPGSCKFLVEWRPIPKQSVSVVEKHLRAVVDELTAQDPSFRARIDVQRGDQGVDTPESSEVVRFLAEQSGNPAATVAFGTEAPQLTELGAEAVVFGPGDIRVAHQTGEFVPLTELKKCEEILERTMTRFCL